MSGRGLVEWMDVDYLQWRALVRTSLRIDFGALRGFNQTEAKRLTGGLWTTGFIYLLAGLTPSVVILFSHDALLGATMLSTVVAFMLLSTLLVGEGAAIMAPDDQQVLGFRPVTSRTYFAVRVAAMFIRTIVIVTFIALAPALVFCFKDGFRPALAFGALVTAYGTGIAVTLAVIALYGWLLRLTGPERMLRYVAYVQLAAMLVSWGGFFALSSELGKHLSRGVALSNTVWALIYPGAWFASFVALAQGNTGWRTWVPASLSVLTLIGFSRVIGGKLSLGYAESVRRAAAASAPAAAAGPTTGWLRLLTYETRAVAILVRSQLRHNMRFRMGLVSMIPITVMYMFIGSRNGGVRDPFVPDAGSGGNIGMVQLALMFVPMTLRRTLITSDSFRASWVFHTTPADLTRLVLSSRNIIVVFFLVPYLCFLAAVFAYSFGNPLHAIVHAVCLGGLSYLVLQFTVMVDPQLPFSLPHNKDTQTGVNFASMIAVMVIGTALYFLLIEVVYKTGPRMAGAVVAFAIVAYGMNRLTRRRIERRTFETGYLA